MNGALLTLFAIGAVEALAVWLLLGLYRERAPEKPAGRVRQFVDLWGFSAQDLGGFAYSKLALVSVLGLFLEMLLIRWISSEVRIFAYFKNFVLVACFLGYGLGCYLGKRRANLLGTVLPLALLVLLVEVPRGVIVLLPELLGATSEVQTWGVPSVPTDASTLLALAAGIAVSVPAFALIAFALVPVGQLLGFYLESSPRGVLAYTIDVLGSLAGILLYTLLCFYDQPPVVWFALAGALMAVLFWSRPRLRWTVVAAFLGVVLVVGSGAEKARTYWSPYQKLTLGRTLASGEVIAHTLKTNDSWYQQVIDLSPGFVAKHPQLFALLPVEWNAYNLPYKFYPRPPRVLVLGAGMGNDVAAALRNGAGSVTAVEIDPLIVELGKELHFEKPYDPAKGVKIVVDDARSYVQNTTEKYDLVLFSLLDSHTTSSHFSNIRIDNYVYTVEAMRAARRLLSPDGVLMVKFSVGAPWLAGRLAGLLEDAFGTTPVTLEAPRGLYTSEGFFFIAGSRERIAAGLASSSELSKYVRPVQKVEARLTTDDWPYFYQHQPGIPVNVIAISAALLLLSVVLARTLGGDRGPSSGHFFFLGAGFMLLEAQIVSKMALLFGTTWVVNSIVISALLLFIVVANGVVAKWPKLPRGLAYVGLFVSLAVAWAVPIETFFFASPVLKGLAAAGVLCLPVFFAGLVFIRSFAEVGFRSEAFGANLFGSLVGGLLESLSFWTGLRALVLIAAGLYLLSALALRGRQSAARA